MIVVTGANGFVGNNLVRLLVAQGETVRCMVYPASSPRSIAELDAEIVYGDVRQPASLTSAFAGADVVYNVAGVIAIAPGKERLMEEVNINGARNVATACVEAGVRRLCHVSSCHALKEPPGDEVFDERQPFDTENWMFYGRTKALGALAIMDAVAKQGLDAVIACPTGMVGPNDYEPSEMGKMILDFASGRLLAVTPGGYDFADVRDVATGLVALAAKGKTGEYYLLGGHWASVEEMVGYFRSTLGDRSKPRLIAGRSLYLAADLMGLVYGLSGSTPRITRDSIRTLLSNANFSSAKATVELGYQTRPLEQTIRDAINWFRDQHLVR